VFPVWETDFRYLIPAGALTPGVHTVTWTSTFTSDFSYSLGCTDPSGRCTTPGRDGCHFDDHAYDHGLSNDEPVGGDYDDVTEGVW